MSLFIAGAIAGVSLVAGLLVAVSEQIRVELCRRRSTTCEEQRPVNVARLDGPLRSNAASAADVSAESRAADYREILDALGNELDEDTAEWEAVLQEFPQVIGAEELRAADNRPRETITEVVRETFTSPHRTRRISADERGMIQRLLNTGFACEEIALWLNLPLERVQELLPHD